MKGDRWRVLRFKNFAGRPHSVDVMPIHDTRNHKPGPACWCKPRLETTDDGLPMYGHNAKDGRELMEEHGVN